MEILSSFYNLRNVTSMTQKSKPSTIFSFFVQSATDENTKYAHYKVKNVKVK